MSSKERVLWKEIFVKENINVDMCLAKYTQKADLETLRKEMKDYAIELHQQVSEVLKAETESIVNLAEYLTYLNTRIENLAVPVCQLQEEIKTLYNLMKGAQQSFEKSLNDLQSASSDEDHLKLKFDLISSCLHVNRTMDDLPQDLTLLERAVITYSSRRNYLEELEKLAPDVENNINEVDYNLLQILNTRFLSALNKNDSSIITRCLHMYDNLNRHNEAESMFQANIVRPGLRTIICERNLAKHNQNLDEIHIEILNFMDVDTVINLIKRNPELKSFNFVRRSFWPEIDKQLREGLPHVTAPGNPDLFQKRFLSSWNLINEIAKRCEILNLVRQDETFQNYIRRFNLPVYFEIRLQQIAGKYEQSMLLKPGNDIYTNDGRFKLKVSSMLYASLVLCFAKFIFLVQLTDQFLKLSMLLIARYFKWLDTVLLEEAMYRCDLDDWEMFIMSAVADMHSLKNYVGLESDEPSYRQSIENTVYSVIPDVAKDFAFKTLVMNNKMINNKIANLTLYVEDLKIRDCLSNFHNITAIPRLYRRTNRSAPKEPSTYVVEAVRTVVNFNSRFATLLGKEFIPIIDSIILKISEQYHQMIQELLSSVGKTEESLRRLKSRTFGTTEESAQSSDTISDEMKIREQIKLDVLYFIDQLYSLGGDSAEQVMGSLRNTTVY